MLFIPYHDIIVYYGCFIVYTIGVMVDGKLIANRRQTMTAEERIARLEGEIGHIATKADIEAVRGEIGKLSTTLTWRMILVAGAIQTLGIGALLQFLPRT